MLAPTINIFIKSRNVVVFQYTDGFTVREDVIKGFEENGYIVLR